MLALGTSAQIRARGTFSDQTTQDLTSLVTWSSSNPEVAQVTALGQVQGLQVGSTQLEASLGEVSKVAALEVSEATVLSLAVVTTTGEPPQVPTGQSLSLQAVATLADNSFQNVTESVTWSVDQSLLGSLGNPSGGSILLNTLNSGLITVSANLQAQGTTFSAELPISILATRPDFILAGGTTHHLNTDTGGYTVDGVPRSLPGWDPSNGRLSVGRFTVEAGATLNLEGSRAFQVSASDPIVVEDATISFSGQNGANGQSGTSSTPAGGIGERGGNIALVTSSSLTVDGQILNRGGSGGNNNFSDYGPAGGNGGAGGSLTLLAQGAITLGGNLSSSGGPGGSSNSSFASNASGFGSNGGRGGNGGSITGSANEVQGSFPGNTVQGGQGNSGGSNGSNGSITAAFR